MVTSALINTKGIDNDATTFGTSQINGLNFYQNVDTPINSVQYNVKVNTYTPTEAAELTSNTMNVGIGYEGWYGTNSHARLTYPVDNSDPLNTGKLDSNKHPEQSEQGNAYNPDIYINIGKYDSHLENFKKQDYSRIANTAFHETLYQLGLGDAYGTGDRKDSKEGSTSMDANGNALTNTINGIMLKSDGKFRDMEATKLAASLITDNFQVYDFGDKPMSAEGNQRMADSRQKNILDENGTPKLCRILIEYGKNNFLRCRKYAKNSFVYKYYTIIFKYELCLCKNSSERENTNEYKHTSRVSIIHDME